MFPGRVTSRNFALFDQLLSTYSATCPKKPGCAAALPATTHLPFALSLIPSRAIYRITWRSFASDTCRSKIRCQHVGCPGCYSDPDPATKANPDVLPCVSISVRLSSPLATAGSVQAKTSPHPLLPLAATVIGLLDFG